MQLPRISQAAHFARPRLAGRDGAPQGGAIRIRTAQTPGPREVKQQLLETMLDGANANKVRDLANARPDLMEAASPDQRARMSKILLDRLFFGAGDRQAILAILKPAHAVAELPASVGAIKGHGRLGALFRQMGDLGEGLDLARLGLAGGIYHDLDLVGEMGTTGVKALVRVATDDHLEGLSREAKAGMIATLQSGPQTDEVEVMIRRLRNHLN
ncbi:MAG: hypothetical protein FJZ01_17645 [Candidatus Sericytochromatia bacterium]|nr:hypothetical protein [Candidatus Tanganyikabacteria bacterium]